MSMTCTCPCCCGCRSGRLVHGAGRRGRCLSLHVLPSQTAWGRWHWERALDGSRYAALGTHIVSVLVRAHSMSAAPASVRVRHFAFSKGSLELYVMDAWGAPTPMHAALGLEVIAAQVGGVVARHSLTPAATRRRGVCLALSASEWSERGLSQRRVQAPRLASSAAAAYHFSNNRWAAQVHW